MLKRRAEWRARTYNYGAGSESRSTGRIDGRLGVSVTLSAGPTRRPVFSKDDAKSKNELRRSLYNRIAPANFAGLKRKKKKRALEFR